MLMELECNIESEVMITVFKTKNSPIHIRECVLVSDKFEVSK